MNQSFPFDHFLKNNNQDSNPVHLNTEQAHKDNQSTQETKDTVSNDTENLRFLSQSVMKSLEGCIAEQKFETCFSPALVIKEVTQEKVTFELGSELQKELIIDGCLSDIKMAVFNILGSSYHLDFVVRKSQPAQAKNKGVGDAKFTLDLNYTKEDKASKAEAAYMNHVNPHAEEILIDPKKTFDTFVSGPSNNIAFSTAKAVAANPGKKGSYPSLYIHSGSGLGKTHLLHAVANEVRERYPELVICLISAQDFVREIIDCLRTNKMDEFNKKYSEKVDLLMIDDVHEIKNKETTQDIFFNLFNELHKKGKQLIFTSDVHPSKIDGIHDRIKTRLGWGLVIDIQKPDLETRTAILKTKAKELDLYLSEDILNLIATSIRSSIRELEGALVKLHAYSQFMEIDFDYETVKDFLQLSAPEDAKVVTQETIAKATSQYYKIPLADLKSKSRIKEVAKARHVAMYLARKILNHTFDEIGKYFGGRDHSSVVHAEKTVVEKLKTDSALSKDLNYIENNL